ncbi:unnamed protein product [Arabis nemorensis]|uniref:Histone deacetylase interacting domain-containing protein n=1 Tax=Arabis nemorensis TaxID=586526 RepID=A0A565ATV4_9BRAS|nr:unnamed protein product [Arabis nemorensis]
MVGRSESPEPSFEYSCSYIDAVKEAFQDEPAKYDLFKKLLNDYIAKRVDRASLITRVEELMRDHRKLLPGFSVFHSKANNTTIPPEAKRVIPPEPKTAIPLEPKTTISVDVNTTILPEPKITIPPEPNGTTLNDANKGLGQLLGRRVSSELTIEDSLAYIAAVKEAFKDEPEKYEEFLKILKYLDTHRENKGTCHAGVKELMKDHPNLFLGFNAFLPAESKITIPPGAYRAIPLTPIRAIPLQAIRAIPLEAKTTAPPEAKATAPPKAKITIVFKPKRTIPRETNRTIPLEAERTIPTEAERTMAPEANATSPPEYRITIIPKAKRTIPPEPEHHGAESNCTKVEADSLDFINKLKTRFRTLDTHVVESFFKIMRKFREGKKSKKEVHREVVDLLYYHEDLIEDFSRFLTKKHYIHTR